MWSSEADSATGPILLALEAAPQSQAVVAAAAKLARQLRAEVLVLSVRERDYARGFAWDIHQPGEIAETVSRAIYEMVARAADARRRLPGPAPLGSTRDRGPDPRSASAQAQPETGQRLIAGPNR